MTNEAPNEATIDRHLRWSRRLSVVPRWSVVPTIMKQHVDGHSYNVVMLCMWLMQFHPLGDNADFQLKVLHGAALHDVHEAAEGDRPTPSKTPSDYSQRRQSDVVVKVADILDAWLFMCDERRMGNREMPVPIMTELMGRLTEVLAFFLKKDGVLSTSYSDHKNAEQLTIALYKVVYGHPAMHPGMEHHNG